MTRLNPQTTPATTPRREGRSEQGSGLAAFIGKKAEIDGMLARLQASATTTSTPTPTR